VKDLVEDGNRVMKGYYWQLDKMTEDSKHDKKTKKALV